MFLRTIVVLFTLTFMSTSYGQNERYLSFELAGSGGLASLNLEKTFLQKENLKIYYRTGFSFSPLDKNNGTVLIFPQLIHTVFGKQKHFIDFGIGLAPSFTTKFGGAFVRMPLSFGYRFQPQDKNYYW